MNLFVTSKDNERLETALARAESRIASLESELRQERERHFAREDEFIAIIVKQTGNFAPKTPTLALVKKDEESEKLPKLNGVQEGTLIELEQAAINAGRPASDGTQYFWDQYYGRPTRVQLPEAEPVWQQ